MNRKELQELFALEIRKHLDPIVEEAGYSPEDYEIVWTPIESLDIQSLSDKVKKDE